MARKKKTTDQETPVVDSLDAQLDAAGEGAIDPAELPEVDQDQDQDQEPKEPSKLDPGHRVVVQQTESLAQIQARKLNPLNYISNVRLKKYAMNIGAKFNQNASRRGIMSAVEKKWKSIGVVFPGSGADNVKVNKNIKIGE
jgi:hypothetical protein